jgi:outer membrane cobalamin receptor
MTSLGQPAWEDGEPASIRESGNLANRGRPFSARETPEGAPMRTDRSPGRVSTRRLIHLVLAATLAAPAAASAADLSGVVVDSDGRPLPRVHVRVLDSTATNGSTDRTTSETFTDQTGRFQLNASEGACVVEAALTGFRTTRVACAATQLTIQLPLAPLEETVVVTATRTEMPASQTGLSVTTFTADEIAARQEPMVSELLRTSPGAMVLQTGAPGGVTGLFVRGGESNYNAVLLDGIPLDEPGGTFNFNALTTENVERIEVVRGANSALFGSDAMSSVVQIFTRRGIRGSSSKPALTAQIDGGSYGTLHASAAASGVVNGVDYSFAAARLSTDNRVPNSALDDTTLSANVGTMLGTHASLRGVFRADMGTAGTPGQTVYGRPDRDAFYDHDNVSGGVTFESDLTPALHQRATYALSSSRQASTNLVEDPPYTPAFDGRVAPFEFSDFAFDSRNTFRRHYASYQADLHLPQRGAGDHRITILVDWNGERARLEDRLGGDRSNQSRDNVGAAVQHQLLWRRLATTAGIRLEHNASFGSAVVPRGSAVFSLHEGSGSVGDTRIRAAAGLGIKEPTVLQSFSTSPYFRGNPGLEPERSRAVEAGIEQRLADDRARLDITWFDNRYRNIIGLRPDGAFTSTYFNIGLTRARGAEIATEVAPLQAVRLRGGYTFVDSKILKSTSTSSPVLAAGNWAFRRPRHSAFVQGTLTLAGFTADVTGTIIGRYVDSDFSSLEPPIIENPGRTLWDAALSYRVTRAVTGLLNIDNLTGRDYQEPLGYLALQRSIRVGVRVGL